MSETRKHLLAVELNFLTVHDDARGHLMQFSLARHRPPSPSSRKRTYIRKLLMLKQQSWVSCLLKLQSSCNTNPSCYSLPWVRSVFGTVSSQILKNTINFLMTEGILGTKCFPSTLKMLSYYRAATMPRSPNMTSFTRDWPFSSFCSANR